MNKSNQRKRVLRRTSTVLLAVALLLSVCGPAMLASAEETGGAWTVEQGGRASYCLPEGIRVERAGITPEDGGLRVTAEESRILLDASDAEAGAYRVELICDDGSDLERTVTVLPRPMAAGLDVDMAPTEAAETEAAGGERPDGTAPETAEPVTTEETAPEVTEETAPEATEETAPEATEETVPEAAEETAPDETGPEGVEEILSEEELLALLPMADGDPDLTLEQGESGEYACGGSQNISRVFSSGLGNGMTAEANGTVIRVATSENTPAGDYTVRYLQGGSLKSFLVRVVQRESGGGTGTGPITETKSLTYEKTVMDNGDGTFALELTVSGAVGSQTDPAQVDVIFIVDNSNSMYPSYMPGTKDAMRALVDDLDGNENIDARYSMVLYGTYAGIESGYTGASAIRTAINGIRQQSIGGSSDTGGTNYAAGIYYGKQLINQRRSGAMTVVIFLTDGKPTYRGGYPGGGNLAGNGSNDNEGRNIRAAVTEIGGMNCNYFYGVGLGSGYEDNLSELVGAVHAAHTGVYSAGNTAQITEAFHEIAASVTTFLCDHVTVTDYLRTDGAGERMLEVTDPASVAVVVTRTDGSPVAGPGASVTLPATDRNAAATLRASYDAQTGRLVLNFPETYQLEPDYVYKLQATIAPTEAAYQRYREDGGYTHTGEPGTGTYAGQPGIPTNDSATVAYTYQNTPGSAQYPLPVVPLNPGRLTVTKTFTGLTQEQITQVAGTLQFRITLNGTRVITVSLTDMELTDGVYAFAVDGLSPGTAYTVTETGGALEGFQWTAMVNGEGGTTAEGTVPGGESRTAAYENAYAPANTRLTVRKTVAGNMGDVGKRFPFTLTLDRPISPRPGAGAAYTVSEDGKTVTFDLADGQTVIIEDVPIGAELTLTEREASAYGVTMNGVQVKAEADPAPSAAGTFPVEPDLEIAVVNRHDADIDTGVVTDPVPWALPLFLAALAGGALLGRKRRA